MKTFVIAEAGSTWRIGKRLSNQLAYAKKCIHIAHASGADAVKFQWASRPGDVARRRSIANVGVYHWLGWPEEWIKDLHDECERIGIEFMCTVFLPQDVKAIAPYVKRFKVASLEEGDRDLISVMEDECHRITTVPGPCEYSPRAGTYIKPIYISVGATDSWSFTPACGWLLHCVCGYPAPIEQMNLNVLSVKLFRKGDYQPSHYGGLSDHSGDVLTGALAVACGAEIVEVHFRLDETRKDNPDFPHSHAPAKLREYIANIRKAERMLGDGVKKIEACERPLVKHRVVT